VERRPEVPFINNEQKYFLVPRLALRLIVVEWYLLHNLNRSKQTNYKQRSLASRLVLSPCCGAATDARFKEIKINKLNKVKVWCPVCSRNSLLWSGT
jgi:hypothetical protein